MRNLEPDLANDRIMFHGWPMPRRSLSSKGTRLDMHFTSLSPTSIFVGTLALILYTLIPPNSNVKNRLAGGVLPIPEWIQELLGNHRILCKCVLKLSSTLNADEGDQLHPLPHLA